MIGFAVKSGYYISADTLRRHLTEWRDGSALWGVCRVFWSALAAGLLSACAISAGRYAPGKLSNTNAASEIETGFQVPLIAPAALKTDDRRRYVAFETTEVIGTVVVDMAAGSLYLVTGEGRAMRYRIEPLVLKGAANASDRAENWTVPNRASGTMIKMRNPRDAEDLHQRMPAGGKVVFLSSSK